MFTKMRNLQKQIDVVILLFKPEWQKIQWNHGWYWKAQERNQRSQTRENHVQEQPQIAINWHRESWSLNHQLDGKHREFPKQFKNEPEPHAQLENEKRRRQVKLLQATQRTQQAAQRPQTQQSKQNQDRWSSCYPKRHSICAKKPFNQINLEQQVKSETYR